jgi:hypothetical protein
MRFISPVAQAAAFFGRSVKIALTLLVTNLIGFAATANLLIHVEQTKLVGQKAITRLEMKNTFPDKIGSARGNNISAG